MGNKRVLESTGKIIDLDRGEGVESLPAESLQMDKHTYGASSHTTPFSLIFNGSFVDVVGGHNQFFETTDGARRLILELSEMKKFPRVFPVSLHQNYSTGDVYFIIYVRINGIEHKLRLTYDYRHPLVKMEVVVEYPDLDQRYMQGHWYGRNLPCYIHYWTKDWSALKVAVQMCFWLHDYYNDRNGRNPEYYVRKTNDVNITTQDVDNLLRQINERIKFGGFQFR
ncbi:MAG: hypothetical protein KGI27_01560 [Thaumarchaeota archaeon]|nr:hypothetical protein [Nitrososphaerota archaeon]